MTKLEKELRRREERRINSINKAESDLAEDALRVLWNVVLIMIGVVIGLMLSASRSQAAETVSIPPRCVYVGAIPTEAQKASQPPTGANETPLASMPDAEKVEAVGERWESLGVWLLSAYCPESCCNGRGRAWKTASGAPMMVGDTVAVGWLPFGTKLKIRDHIYTVTDRGVTGKHVDILHESHRAANRFGLQHAEVFIKRGK